MATKCTACGRAFAKPRAAKPAAGLRTADMTDAQLFAHCKQTAPVQDLEFFLRATASYPDIQSDGRDLLAMAFDDNGNLRGNRAEYYRALANLQDRWRRLSNARVAVAVFGDDDLTLLVA